MPSFRTDPDAGFDDRRPTRLTRRHALHAPFMLKSALVDLMVHDGLNLARSGAYSAMIALFPGLVLMAAVITLLPDVTPLKIAVGEFFNQVLPANVTPLLTGYFVTPAGAAVTTTRTVRALVVAGLVSFSGASNAIATIMEGLRRAQGIPRKHWTFWERRLRAWVLMPLSLLTIGFAMNLVVFGRYIADGMAEYMSASVRPVFYAVALLVRWGVALGGVVGLTALIFHIGSRRRPGESHLDSWIRTLPGAIVATAIWFISTLAFGWYVTRLANYNQVYGSLGAGIALLFWLYIVFLSVLCGAEFNIQYSRYR